MQVGHKLTEVEYEILNILEFDSTRKRMSVICRTPDNRILLYCKVQHCSSPCYNRLADDIHGHACCGSWPSTRDHGSSDDRRCTKHKQQQSGTGGYFRVQHMQ